MPVNTFDFSFTVRAPLEAVAAFHRDPSALRRLTPPPVFARMHRVEPMAEGSISDFTLWFGPLPLHWVAEHTSVDALRGFTDTQIQGPMERWVHKHSFTEDGNGMSRITEHIEFKHYGGPKGITTRLLLSSIGLWVTFCYRRMVTRRALESRTN